MIRPQGSEEGDKSLGGCMRDPGDTSGVTSDGMDKRKVPIWIKKKKVSTWHSEGLRISREYIFKDAERTLSVDYFPLKTFIQ